MCRSPRLCLSSPVSHPVSQLHEDPGGGRPSPRGELPHPPPPPPTSSPRLRRDDGVVGADPSGRRRARACADRGWGSYWASRGPAGRIRHGSARTPGGERAGWRRQRSRPSPFVSAVRASRSVDGAVLASSGALLKSFGRRWPIVWRFRPMLDEIPTFLGEVNQSDSGPISRRHMGIGAMRSGICRFQWAAPRPLVNHACRCFPFHRRVDRLPQHGGRHLSSSRPSLASDLRQERRCDMQRVARGRPRQLGPSPPQVRWEIRSCEQLFVLNAR